MAVKPCRPREARLAPFWSRKPTAESSPFMAACDLHGGATKGSNVREARRLLHIKGLIMGSISSQMKVGSQLATEPSTAPLFTVSSS